MTAEMGGTHHATRVSTVFGTIVSTVLNIGQADLMRTAVLGAIGGISGLLATLALKWVMRKVRALRRGEKSSNSKF